MSASLVGEELPALLTDADLMRVLKIGRTTFYKLRSLHRFDRWLVSPQITPHRLYSGALVQKWMDGEGVFAPARKRA